MCLSCKLELATFDFSFFFFYFRGCSLVTAFGLERLRKSVAKDFSGPQNQPFSSFLNHALILVLMKFAGDLALPCTVGGIKIGRPLFPVPIPQANSPTLIKRFNYAPGPAPLARLLIRSLHSSVTAALRTRSIAYIQRVRYQSLMVGVYTGRSLSYTYNFEGPSRAGISVQCRLADPLLSSKAGSHLTQ